MIFASVNIFHSHPHTQTHTHFKNIYLLQWFSSTLYIYIYIYRERERGWPPPKKNRVHIHVFLTEIHKFNSTFFFFFRIWSRFCAWRIGTIVFSNMSWSTKEKTFCVEAFIFVEVIKKFMGSVGVFFLSYCIYKYIYIYICVYVCVCVCVCL